MPSQWHDTPHIHVHNTPASSYNAATASIVGCRRAVFEAEECVWCTPERTRSMSPLAQACVTALHGRASAHDQGVPGHGASAAERLPRAPRGGASWGRITSAS
jgi:hypothetical protein